MMGSAPGVWILLALGVAVAAIVFWSHRRQGRLWRDQLNRWRLEQKSLQEDVRRHTEDYRRFRDALGLLSERPAGEPITDALVQALQRASGCRQVVLFQAQPFSSELRIVSGAGVAPEVLLRWRLHNGEKTIGIALKTAKPQLLHEASGADTALKLPCWIVPLYTRDRLIGAFVLADSESKPAGDLAEKLALLSAPAALLLDNDALSRRNTEADLRLSQSLARAVDARDAYTHRHSSRTSRLVRAMASELKLPEALVRHIETGALLHDLGKIGVADGILLKPGKLTAEEYGEMKKHPGIGFDILAEAPTLQPAAQIILYHHEWYNGQGYPEGLSGGEIPLGARLVAIIDAWDAMTSNRPYRKALSKAAAIAELRRQAGVQFDPQMVESFTRVIDRLEHEGVAVMETAEEAVSFARPA